MTVVAEQRVATMARTPEPEKMSDEEEFFYHEADYSAPHDQLVDDIVSTVNQKHIKAIDIGCGPGDVMIRMRKRAPDWELFGLDFSIGMLGFANEDAKSRAIAGSSPINWVVGDGKGSGFRPHSFDVLICNSVLHHFDNALLFWKEVKRLVKPQGFVFVRDLRRPQSAKQAQKITKTNVGQESAGLQKHYLSSLHSSYTINEVRAHLQQNDIIGLAVTELEDRYLDVQGRIV